MLSIEQRVSDVLAALREHVPHRFIDDAAELNAAGEWGVAIEILCENLHDDDVPLPEPLIARLRSLGEEMRLAPRYWEGLVPAALRPRGVGRPDSE